MTLYRYIDKHGIIHLADLLGVSERRVKSWYYGERSPRPKMAKQIEQATRGKVKLKECY